MPYQSTWNNPYLSNPYLPYGQTQQVQPYAQYQQPVNGILKVNGKESALRYQLPPNSTSPAIFDENGKTFYVVSTDGTGSKSVEVFDFLPHANEAIEVDGARFVSREEFDTFVKKVSAAIGAIDGSDDTASTTESTVKPTPRRQSASKR